MKKFSKEYIKAINQLEVEQIMVGLHEKFLIDIKKKKASIKNIDTFLYILEEKRKHLYKLYKLS
jgi:hypothetical protein